MKFEYKHLDELVRAYAVAILTIDGETACLVASEEKGYPCYMYSGKEFAKKEVVWQDGGGCMSIIQIPNKENEFLAVRDFYLKESPSRAKLVWGKYQQETGWVIKDVSYLPYLHRFDIFNINGENWVLALTIADEKEFKEDWRKPGSVYRAKLPDDPSQGVSFEKISTGYFRNHGYYRLNDEGYFTSDQGIFKLEPHNDWKISKIMDGQIGEVALKDVNRDGKLELITIEPFHGDAIKIYELNDKNEYEKVFDYPFEIDFAHTLVGADLAGVPCFVGGVRRKSCDLFVITYQNNEYQVTVVDNGGPSNLMVGDNFIISANHTRNESAIYFVSE